MYILVHKVRNSRRRGEKVYSPLRNIGRHCFSHFECLTRFVNRILDVLRCPGVIYLKAVSETSLGACAAHSHGLVYRCISLFSAQPSCVPSSVSSTPTEELMQLDCSWASSGTTSNDITSICDVHHQQRSHLKGIVNRHLSRLAGREGPLPAEKEASNRP